MGIDIELLAEAYKRANAKQTNLQRIKTMDIPEFIAFLKTCRFDGVFPVIEGRRFYNEEELIDWFNEEVGNEVR